VAQQVSATRRPGLPRAFAQARDEALPSGMERGQQAEEQAGRQPQRDGEGEHRRVQRQAFEVAQVRGQEPEEIGEPQPATSRPPAPPSSASTQLSVRS
jgi:hypothetical protein